MGHKLLGTNVVTRQHFGCASSAHALLLQQAKLVTRGRPLGLNGLKAVKEAGVKHVLLLSNLLCKITQSWRWAASVCSKL